MYENNYNMENENFNSERRIIGTVLFDVKFRSETILGVTSYKSSAPGRKIVILKLREGQDAPPNPDQGYDVVVWRDTKPNDPNRGAFIVHYVKDTHDRTNEGGDAPEEERVDPRNPYIPLAIEIDSAIGQVYVLDTVIPFNGKGGEAVPKEERFKHFTLDQRTLETLEKIATAVELREPCLLEGETSTSKTSAIEYLAMVTNNEIVRLNLNGQTDTSELIGKFVPNDGDLQISFEELLKNHETLSEKSQSILKKANDDGRGLTRLESEKIAQAEGLKVPDWRWQNGLDIQAKKKGQWLILDEINLAEPQILERLNSQLEKNPAITLSENGGVTIRVLNNEERELYNAGKLENIEPLDPNFRIFATMNPAEYSGRQPMSPAYKDRWTSYKYVTPPTKEDYTAMMNLMIYGEQPEIISRGAKYKNPDTEGMMKILRGVPAFQGFVFKMAKFQEAIESLARKREIGKERKEKYIFTRRGLIEFLTYLETKTLVDRRSKKKITVRDAPEEVISRAIKYYYLDKISNPEDLRKVKDQLDINGISEDRWTHKFV